MSTTILKTRNALFKQMTPATQEVAKQFEASLAKTATGLIMVQYSIGARLCEIQAEEKTYGTNAIRQLADWLGQTNGFTTFTNLMNLSREFDKQTVKAYSERPMSNGLYLTREHWFNFIKIADPKKRINMLERTLEESLTSGELEVEIRAGVAGAVKNARSGGRNPKRPSSPMIGLQATSQIATRLVRWEDTANKSIFNKLDEMSADDVTDSLLAKTTSTLQLVKQAEETAHKMRTHLEENVERLNRILKKKAGAKSKDDDEEDDEDEAPKAQPKKKKKKKKNRVPVTAE